MGWFDDSDSEDENKKPRKRLLPLDIFNESSLLTDQEIGVAENAQGACKISTTAGSVEPHSCDKAGAATDDPLDFYMNMLSNNSKEVPAIKQSSRGRLDMENEDEATIHWNSTSSMISIQDGNQPSSKKNANEEEVGRSMPYQITDTRRKTSIVSNSHKAGLKIESRKQGISLEFCDEIDDRKQSIDPLESVNHAHIDYEDFNKQFHQPHNTPFGSTWRIQNGVSCSVEIDPILSWGQSSANKRDIFTKDILSYLHCNNFRQATPVQAQSIPVALAGHDLLVTSRTGSGKTLAYLLPLVTHVIDQRDITPNVDGPIGVILTPTRELSKQVHFIAKKILHVVGGKAVSVTGGSGTYAMTKELKKGCEVVVSTPGRFIHMVKSKATNCKRVTFIILDEADKLLEMGFESQCSSILNSINPTRQTLLFSATFGKKVERVAKGWLRNPVRIAIGKTGISSEHVQQHVLVLPNYSTKVLWLQEMLPTLSNVGKMIIFVQSRADVDALTQKLRESNKHKINVVSIHGDKHQSDRNAALSALRKGSAALVATDVASRGLDIKDIATIINFDPAKNLDSHVHRIGRAGRIQDSEHKKGVAYTLLTPKDAHFAKLLVSAFRSERREVSADLLQLSMRSKQFGVQEELRHGQHLMSSSTDEQHDRCKRKHRWI